MITNSIEDNINKFESIHNDLKEIANELQIAISEMISEELFIDKIGARVKTIESFKVKISKKLDGKLKYKIPLREVQDQIGVRVVVYYKDVAEKLYQLFQNNFNTVEVNKFVPDEVSRFGYEGLHLICFIPSHLINKHKDDLYFPQFFELQIKTLFQHAWGQAEHGLGYKPEISLLDEERRKLAFIAAQSWGADTILSELYKAKLVN